MATQPDRKQRYDAKRQATQPWRSLYRTKQWREIRAGVLARHPICNICKKAKADTVDHIERHFGDPVKFFTGKLQALCAKCHNGVKQSHEKTNKSAIGLDGWPLS